MSTTIATSTSLPVTIDPQSDYFVKRRLACDDYISKLSTQYEPGRYLITLEIIQSKQIEFVQFSHNLGTYCEAHFDGWSCIPEVLAGEIAKVSCPDILTFDINSKKFSFI